MTVNLLKTEVYLGWSASLVTILLALNLMLLFKEWGRITVLVNHTILLDTTQYV